MGREIRRVIPNWEHPKRKDWRGEESYQPLFDQDYETAMGEWIQNHNLWLEGKHPDQLKPDSSGRKYKYYAQWNGNAPDVEYYRPKWAEGEATWYQLYETVSEGSPVSPPFEKPEELIDYLATHGDFWDQQRGDGPYSREAAESIVRGGWAPSFVAVGSRFYRGAEGLVALEEHKNAEGANQ